MHFHIADSFLDTDSPLHHADPRVKLVTALALILLISLTPVGSFATYLGYFVLIMVGAVAAGLAPWTVLKRSLVVLPFAGAAATLLFTVPGRTLATVPWVGWTISEPGAIRFTSILFKSLLSVQVAVLLTATTHFTDVLWAAGALRVPAVLVAIVSFMYRYIFVLADEALRLTRAREARSATLPGVKPRGRSLVFRARSTGRLIGSLLLRSLARSERVYQAMVARGYRGTLRRLDAPHLHVQDVWIGAVPVLAGVFLTGLSLLLR